jgi:hypothetical protein
MTCNWTSARYDSVRSLFDSIASDFHSTEVQHMQTNHFNSYFGLSVGHGLLMWTKHVIPANKMIIFERHIARNLAFLRWHNVESRDRCGMWGGGGTDKQCILVQNCWGWNSWNVENETIRWRWILKNQGVMLGRGSCPMARLQLLPPSLLHCGQPDPGPWQSLLPTLSKRAVLAP